MKKLERFIVYPALTIIFAIVAFYDFSISEALYDPNNVFGELFEAFAEMPCYLMSIFACWLIFRFHPAPKKEWDMAIRIVSFLVALGISFYGGYHTSGLLVRVYRFSFSRLGLAAILTLPYFGAGFGLSFLAKKECAKEAFLLGVYFLVTMACSVLLMQALKMVWLRPRYRTLMALKEAGAIDDVSQYWLPFYHPQLFTAFSRYQSGGSYGFNYEEIVKTMEILGIEKWGKEEFYSFPSGHVMNTLALMPLCYFARLRGLKDDPNKRSYIRIAIYALGIAVAFSRIVRGAHNATDVVFGYILGASLFDLLSRFFYEGVLREKVMPKLGFGEETNAQQIS